MNFIHRYPWWNSLIFFGSLFHSHSISCPLPTFIMNFNCYLKQYQLYSEYILMEIVSKPNTNYIKRNRCIVLLVRCFFLLKKSLWLIIINLTHMNAQNTHRNIHTPCYCFQHIHGIYRIWVDIIGLLYLFFVVVVAFVVDIVVVFVVVDKNTHITLIDTYP